MSGISTSRHHADWLSLVEVSGPFVSLPVLLKVFPQGLDPRDPAQAKALRAAYEEWQVNPAAPGRQRAWVLHVLTALLGYPSGQITEQQTLPPGLEANMAEMAETLRPDFALVGPTGSETAGEAQLLIASYPAEQTLDRPVIGRHWKANPATRMMELLHASGVALGLVTNGEHWMLVFAPRGETTGYASWYGALWLDEPITLRAFHSLLGVRRFFGVAADSTLLGLLKESAHDQQEVTDQLGYQVREAVEMLVQAFDTLDKATGNALLKGLPETVLYEAALTVMMRLVFLFCAEEKGLLQLGKPLYDNNYAISTLLEQLQEVADQHGEEVLERRSDAWARLLATFRAVHAGVHHQDLLVPAYGGSLFDPDRYPFLEGRGMGTNWTATQAEPLAVDNRVALHLLASLQKLRIKIPGGGSSEARRVSFRALGVEQIGHVYEGLLDHTAIRATEPVLGIKGTRDKEAEIPLTALEAKVAQGQDQLIEFLKDETGRSVSALKRALDEVSPKDEHKLLIACGHDKELLERIRRFAGLIREDSFERPVTVLPGSVYVTVGTTRRSTGTHYTPPSLTEPIVRYTLEPLVYQGSAEGLPRDQWQLRPPKEILDLKVCDMAMGSGAFLVQACRYLAERLTEAWENEEKKHPDELFATPEGDFSQGSPNERLVPHDAAERLAIARRIVADRCLYGVDINPMAVEMAKLSLWLITLDAKRPFTFLDHAFKCGDSLLGITSFQQLETFSLRPEGVKQIAFSTMNLSKHVDEAKKKREALEAMPSDTPEQIAMKVALYNEAEEAVANLKAAADVLVAMELKGLPDRNYEIERENAADQTMAHWAQGSKAFRYYADTLLDGRHTFHWPIAFPEVFDRGGVNCFVCNPPFKGGKYLKGAFGDHYVDFVRARFSHVRGSPDLVAYFLLRSHELLEAGGALGMICTKSIFQGETRESSLDFLMRHRMARELRSIQNQKWPGDANVHIGIIWLLKLRQSNQDILATLDLDHSQDVRPKQLFANVGVCFQGTNIVNGGFIVDADWAQQLLLDSPRYSSVLFPLIEGAALNSTSDAGWRRWIIDFHDWTLNQASEFAACLDVVKERVYPERTKSNRERYRRLWWQFGERQQGLYDAAQKFKRVIVIAYTSNTLAFSFAPSSGVVFYNSTVICSDSISMFAVLQSSIHIEWVRKYGSTLKGDARYAPERCFEPFPFPIGDFPRLKKSGEEFNSFRSEVLKQNNAGLTKTYNRFHDVDDQSAEIVRLRALHVEMDLAAAASYGWSELNLNHGFYETVLGTRYTISETACREVLDRLLDLNHQRHAEDETEKLKNSVESVSNIKRGRKTRAVLSSNLSSLFDLQKGNHEQR
jgi:hypothetical protein